MSQVEVDKVIPQSGTTLTIGDSGDTVTIPSGATLAIAGSVTGFTSTGIDDNATEAALIISSDERVTIVSGAPTASSTTLSLKDDAATTTGAKPRLGFQDSANTYLGELAYASGGSSDLYLTNAQNANLLFSTNNTERMRILSDGKVGIGTSSPSQTLHVLNGTSSGGLIQYDGQSNAEFGLRIQSNISGGNFESDFSNGTTALLDLFANSSATSGGDLLVARTQSSTPVLLVKGNGNVGIGTSSPDGQLHIVGSDTTDQVIIENTDASSSSAPDLILFRNSSSPADNDILGRIDFRGDNDAGQAVDYMIVYAQASDITDGTEDVRLIFEGKKAGSNAKLLTIGEDEVIVNDDSNDVDFRVESDNATHALFVQGSSGFVGIGTSTPQEFLDISDNGPRIRFSDTSITNLRHVIGSESNDLEISCDAGNVDSNSHIRFKVDGSEKARLDANGHLLIAQTATDQNVVGISLNSNGNITAARDGGISGLFNRKASDGAIVSFRGDGTEVGTINVRSDFAVFEFGSQGTGIGGTSTHSWLPMVNNVRSDNTISVGQASYRMTTIFASTGTINTSDQNEKQSIQSLTTAEMNVGKKLSSLIKTYKWNSSVEEKGDSARTHTGIIAQDVQQAFTDEGLDATKYGLWCSDTWSIDADGEEIENSEEVTENNPSKTRLGIRYEQLLSFIQAYNDQRFTELEARITTLENA